MTNKFLFVVALIIGAVFLISIISDINKHNDNRPTDREKRTYEVQLDDIEKGDSKRRWNFCLEYDKWKKANVDKIKRADEICNAAEEMFFMQHEEEIKALK
jgi:regulatory protein YycI of two-component signal transduction system YycFG